MVAGKRFPETYPGRLLKADLEAAGVPYTVPGLSGEPLYFDFHAMRHYYCTWAANLPGISPRTLLALTRHSSVELAMRTYAKVRTEDVRRGRPDAGTGKGATRATQEVMVAPLAAPER